MRSAPKASRLKENGVPVEIPETLQKYLDRNTKPCRTCDKLIGLVDCRLETGDIRTQVIDLLPMRGGWVWLDIDAQGGFVRRFPPYPENALPFRRHSCVAPGNEA